MAHARQQIRDAIITALSGAGLTVYSSRAYAMPSAPSVNVMTVSEDVELDVAGKQSRELEIKVDLHIEAVTDVDDAADAQSVTIEKAILTDSALLALVEWIELSRIESDVSGEGDKPVLLMTHTFTALYRTSETDPEVIIA